MSKTIESKKRIPIEIEMYWRGKRKIPSVNMIFESNVWEGLPNSVDTTKFQEGCDDLCKQLIDLREFD